MNRLTHAQTMQMALPCLKGQLTPPLNFQEIATAPMKSSSGSINYVAVVDDDLSGCRSFSRLLAAAGLHPVSDPSAEAFLFVGSPDMAWRSPVATQSHERNSESTYDWIHDWWTVPLIVKHCPI